MDQRDGEAKRTGRREFLSHVSASAASGVLLGNVASARESRSATLPTVSLGRHQVSRLIVGSNPISGYSYLGEEVDQEMKSFFTPQRTLEFLKQCERAGITTHQFSAAAKTTDVYRQLRDEGSRLQLIGLYSKREDIPKVVDAVQPIALVHHGGVTDRLFREGRRDQVRDFVKAVHDHGLLAGVSAHNPDCIQRIADEGWEVDFFMTCFYYLTRPEPPTKPWPILEGPTVKLKFYRNDPRVMCKVIRQVTQPCLAFKILGAGRKCSSQDKVREAFRFAFGQIKPTDAVIVGMYPRRFDQIQANARYAREMSRIA